MFDCVVLAELFQVKGACPIRAVEEICCKIWDEETEGGSEVEGLVDCRLEIAECDVAAVVR